MNSSPRQKSDVNVLSSTQEDRMHILEFVHILKDRRSWVAASAVLTIIGSLISHTLHIPFYVASSKIEVIGQKENILSKAGIPDMSNLIGFGQDVSMDLQRHVSRLKATAFYISVAETLIDSKDYEHINLTQPSELSWFHSTFWDVRFGRQQFAKSLQKSHSEHTVANVEWLAGVIQDATTIDSDGQSTIFISVKTFDPGTSVYLSNLLATRYSKISIERDNNEVNELRKFLEERLSETWKNLKAGEQAMVAFKQANGSFSFSGGDRIFGEQLKEVETRLGSERLKINQNNNLIQFYSNKLRKQNESILNAGVDQPPAVNDPRVLTVQLDNLRKQKYHLSSRGIGDDDPRVKELNASIRTVVEKLNQEPSSPLHAPSGEDGMILSSVMLRGKIDELLGVNRILETQISALMDARSGLLKSLSVIPRYEQELHSRTETLKLDYELYSLFKKRLQDLQMQLLGLKPSVRIDETSRAAPVEKKIHLFVRVFFGLLMGIFLGSVAVILMEFLNTSVKHGSDIEACDLTVLGNLPHVESKIGSLLQLGEPNSDLLVSATRPNSIEAMAFKYVREQIRAQLTSQGKPVKSVTVTGVDRHNGKSFVACNLAISLAKLDKKVILLDCDFRIPSVHRYFNLQVKDGLTSILGGNGVKYEDLILKTQIKKLDVFPAGLNHPNPTELIGGDNFKQLLSTLYGVYDYVILDSPPAVYVADSPMLASLTDLVLVVASYRKTTKQGLLMAHRKIFQISHKRAFAVMNNVPVVAHEYLPYVMTQEEIQKSA